MIQKPTAFIFDWDNTLVDTWDVTRDIVNHVFKQFNKPEWSIDEIKANTHRSAKDSFPLWFEDKADDAYVCLKTYVLEQQETHLKQLKPKEGAFELLSYLHEKNIPCVILSNKHGIRLRQEVDYLKWNSFFKSVYGSLDFPHDKPDPYPAKMIAEVHSFDLSSTWFLGDTEADWYCALNSGCVPVSIGAENKLTTLQYDSCFDVLKNLNY